MSRKLPVEQVRQLDASDKVSHPVEKATEPACFTFCGAAALHSYLNRNASNPMAKTRTEWELVCPLCNSFIGFWIDAPSDVPLSQNQQRTNRNTSLMGKSHYRKFHEADVARRVLQHRTSTARGSTAGSDSTEDLDDPVSNVGAVPKPSLQARQVICKRKFTQSDLPGGVQSAVQKKAKGTSISLCESQNNSMRQIKAANSDAESDVSEAESESGISNESDASDTSSASMDSKDVASINKLSRTETAEIDQAIRQAERGDVDQQLWLGQKFWRLQLHRLSVHWYKRAAHAGHWKGQRSLAFAYLRGEGLKMSKEKCHEWMLKAAEQGDTVALCRVGDNFRLGRGVALSIAQPMEWYRKAALSGTKLDKTDPKFNPDMARGAAEILAEYKSVRQRCQR